MRTLGIDLAAQDKKTATCAIDWNTDGGLVESPIVGADEPAVLEAMCRADWVGVDAPFGWPDAMVNAIHGYANRDTWPGAASSQKLRYRMTDRFVHEVIAAECDTSLWPLSVSSDRIAVCAWRCARLLSQYSQMTGWRLDRIGIPSNEIVAARGVVEVYPAAALALGPAAQGLQGNQWHEQHAGARKADRPHGPAGAHRRRMADRL